MKLSVKDGLGLFFVLVSIFGFLWFFIYLKPTVSATNGELAVENKQVNSQPVAQVIVVLPKVESQPINFLFFGDLMLDRNVGSKIAKSGLNSLLDPLAGQENSFFIGRDIISANLEGAVTNGGQHYAPVAENDFAFSPASVAVLKKYNFNFFNIANNHNTDQGTKGLAETRKNLADLSFHFSGCADAQTGDCSSQLVEVDGKKVAMVGLSMVYHNFDLESAKKIIIEQKSKSDLVVVNIHWGTEYSHEYNTTQQAIAHALVDSGADLIIGHHPHVVQGLEIYNNKAIFYSLGNFVFDQYFSTDTQIGLAVGVSIDAKTKAADIYLYPLQSRYSVVGLSVDTAKQSALSDLAKWSKLSPAFNNMILQGKINL